MDLDENFALRNEVIEIMPIKKCVRPKGSMNKLSSKPKGLKPRRYQILKGFRVEDVV